MSGSLCDALRWRADRIHSEGHRCPSPPCPFEEEAAELRAAAAAIERYEQALRDIDTHAKRLRIDQGRGLQAHITEALRGN